MRLRRSIVGALAALVLVTFCSAVQAETTGSSAAQADAGLHQPTHFDPFAKLDTHYYSALGAVNRGDYSLAADQFELLRSDADTLGFRGLPLFSEQLLHLALSVRGAREDHEVRFLVSHAVMLSPDDPRVLLGAAKFSREVGSSKSWEYMRRGAAAVFRYPSFILAMSRNIVFAVLVALSLSLFLVCVIQLVSHRLSLLRGLGLRMPLKWRGLLSPLAFLLCLFVPLLGGPMVAAAVWSLLLGRFVRNCSGMGILAGVLLLCWAPAVILIDRLDSTVNSAVTKVAESLEDGSYISSSGNVLQMALSRHGADSRLLHAAGVWAVQRQDFSTAEKYFSLIKGSEEESSAVGQTAQRNLALVKFLTKDFEGAKVLLQREEAESAEMLFLLARLHIAMMDADKHREYFSRANELDPERVSELEAAGDSAMGRLIFSLPGHHRYHRLLSPVFGKLSNVKASGDELLRRQVLIQLARSGSPMVVGGIGLLVLLLGLAVYFRPARVRATEERLLKCEMGIPSMVWVAIPGGYFIRGKFVVSGVFAIAVIIALVITAFNAPIAMLPVLPVSVLQKEVLLWTVLGFALCTMVISVIVHPFEKRPAI